MRRKKRQREVDRRLLNAIFVTEKEWKNLHYMIDNSIDASPETEQYLLLQEAKYMFLLKEAKHRKISVLRY